MTEQERELFKKRLIESINYDSTEIMQSEEPLYLIDFKNGTKERIL